MLRNNSLFFVVITTLYLLAIIYLEDKSTYQLDLGKIVNIAPTLIFLTFSSWIFRYLRWSYLLSEKDYKVHSVRGFLIYLSGFAYTVTPGKLGELIRAKYLENPRCKDTVISAFFYERAFDLLIILLLSFLTFNISEYVFVPAIFVLVIFILLFAIGLSSSLVKKLSHYKKIELMSHRLKNVYSDIRHWLSFSIILRSFVFGFFAWILMGVVFLTITKALEVDLSTLDALGIYPLSMLIGAASMIPGGVGTTEAAIVTILTIKDVSLNTALTIAISARIATLWLAVIIGYISLFFLETAYRK